MVHLAGTSKAGILHWYYDPLPTNCVADWVCAGSEMRGYYNLAAFYGSCTFNCLFCQNWHFRDMDITADSTISAEELADKARGNTFCACFFGGDPSSQMPHALSSARRLAMKGVRICWETNGSMNRRFLKEAINLSLETGGIIKFDLKAFSPGIHLALTGSGNERTLENFKFTAQYMEKRKTPPLLVASTLLVPGYVDEYEIGQISTFIASLNRDIPFALLAFHPEFLMRDLPVTLKSQAEKAFEIAKDAGLTNVRIGNLHLLGF